MNKHEQEKLEADLELLNLRLATAEAECEKIQQELLSIESSQSQQSPFQATPFQLSQIRDASKPSRHGVHFATAGVVAVLTLSFFSVYHDAFSKVTDNSQYEVSAMHDLSNGSIVRNE